EANFKTFLAEAGYKPGEILPLMRLALAGTMQGPGVFEMVELLGRENVILRMNNAVQAFNKIIK
ncbi:MAG TPA: glutamate--tRNA ligase, partial [Saprospiraceae bacterium]|nr:glutamate--tRNA ligase [Saprospiraceae bacterium]